LHFDYHNITQEVCYISHSNHIVNTNIWRQWNCSGEESKYSRNNAPFVRWNEAMLLTFLRIEMLVWGSWAPTKVIVFSWQAFLGRLPTRENLLRRGVACDGAAGCVLCGGGRETEDHLFVSCPTA
jgi:hypothetical protein